ncbi:hypothetical protein l13_16570 [Neisseria weaveri ATCC 51223]|nr:hypothetical protein l13_16570 [Neisseria weaveri ATCC 51223]
MFEFGKGRLVCGRAAGKDARAVFIIGPPVSCLEDSVF